MRIKRRTEINVETCQVLVIRRPGRAVAAWCNECGEQTRMLTLDEAIALSGASSREIHRRVEAGEIHFTETAEGFLLICLPSLLKDR